MIQKSAKKKLKFSTLKLLKEKGVSGGGRNYRNLPLNTPLLCTARFWDLIILPSTAVFDAARNKFQVSCHPISINIRNVNTYLYLFEFPKKFSKISKNEHVAERSRATTAVMMTKH